MELDEDGNERALWEFGHTVEELRKIEAANQFVFDTQYMQSPKPLEGLMYDKLRTYGALPLEPELRKNYTDTADTGSDFYVRSAMSKQLSVCMLLVFSTPTSLWSTLSLRLPR